MSKLSPQIVLASTSVFRKELLERIHLEFLIDSPKCDEDSFKNQGLRLDELSLLLSRKKAESLVPFHPQRWIIGSDQIVSFNGQALSKPGTSEKAIETLTILNGQTHQIFTSVTVINPDGSSWSHLDTTQMRMRQLNPDEIRRYVELEKPFSSAGSYKIEKLGISLFDKIETADTTAIIGLPLLQLCNHLRNQGFNLP